MSAQHDVVYILRNNIANICELIYSLRSLDNLEYNRVCFAGGQHDALRPDMTIPVVQQGETKWQRSTYTLRKICECDDITESFYLFNDDFFILQETKDIPPIYNGDLIQRTKAIAKAHGARATGYSRQLERTADELQRRDLPIFNYAVHVPILINRQKALEVLDAFDGFPMFRCLYGNYCQLGGENRKDVKIATHDRIPESDWQFVSTSDESFRRGAVGQYIRKRFKDKSRFEL